MDKIVIDGSECLGLNLFTGNANLLLIQGRRGLLGCGYFDIATANKVGDAFAIVRGVKTFDDMLHVRVTDASDAAQALGVRPGQTGREALRILNAEGA